MKIESLTLTNFRRFEHLTVDFHDQLTVIVAKNGQGKTTLLDAISIALGPFVGAFDLGKNKGMERTDPRFQRRKELSDNEQIFPALITAEFDGFNGSVYREMNSPKGKTTTKNAKLLSNYGAKLMEQVRALEDVTLPVVAYYGSGRLWNAHKNAKRKAVLSESRTMGYEDCVTAASSFTQVQQWMSKAEYAATQQERDSSYSGYTLREQIDGIQNTVNAVLASEGWYKFHYSITHEELAMSHDDAGILPVSMLSDGVRAMVALVADLAWRCAKLNPHLHENASQQTNGIVLIDEVDMHLHPAWQQKVIQALQQAFPKVQFILTTHSPQVLSTVKKESVRVLSSDLAGNSIASTPVSKTYAHPSNEVMQAVMGTNPVPNINGIELLRSFLVEVELCTDNSQLPELKSRLEDLTQDFGNHDWLTKAKRVLARKEALANAQNS
ncbi:AAA family ATPase [Salinibius halmophilus]|uniref:AAA family ATPase n=1 Tax=Salinibius halmophilus TaxID=1853216 RepID=UPI000E66EF3F|nr:AAA family ATPase [Salinibius halmophilus]